MAERCLGPRVLANQLWDVNRQGLTGAPAVRVIASDQIHGLWAVLRSLGRIGIDTLVSGLHIRAQQFREGLEELGYTVLNEAFCTTFSIP